MSLRSVDNLRVRTGSVEGEMPAVDSTLFVVKNPLATQFIVRSIRLLPTYFIYKSHCMCEGEPTIEMYDGGTLVASIDIHHTGSPLRARPGFRGGSDGFPDPLTRWLLLVWLATNGVWRFGVEPYVVAGVLNGVVALLAAGWLWTRRSAHAGGSSEHDAAPATLGEHLLPAAIAISGLVWLWWVVARP